MAILVAPAAGATAVAAAAGLCHAKCLPDASQRGWWKSAIAVSTLLSHKFVLIREYMHLLPSSQYLHFHRSQQNLTLSQVTT
jgi:hypothetical protein